jgi:FlaA1/EpsC-like NDP-sugar epimerase
LLQFKPQRLVLGDRSENGQFFLERELRNLPSTTEINVCMADINDRVRMKSLLRDYRPDIIFHAAAYKHVPMMESNVGEAVKNITIATRRLADLADEAGVTTFVMISTDKAVNPTSIMGACKRVAELYVQALSQDSDCRFVTVRFGNVLDSAGSVVPIFREQIARGGPVTVTHPDMRRFFMTIPEASQLVIQAGAMGRGGEIFVLDMGDPVRIVDLATDLINLSGFRVGEDIEVRFTGVRPGEKLYEELNVDGEIHLPTSHAKIVIAKGDCHPFNDIVSLIDRLESAADSQPQTIKMFLKSLVSQREHFAHRTQKRRAA